MTPLVALLLLAASAWAQAPALTLVAQRDSVGVGDTLEVRVLVAAGARRLTSAGAVITLEGGIFAPVADPPFSPGDFLPGQPYDNLAAVEGGELLLRFVAVSGTAEEGGRLAGTGQGELARFRVRALAPTVGTVLRLEGVGPRRAIYTEEDQPGVEQRFALPQQPLQVRVGGQALAPATPAVPAAEDPQPIPPQITPPESLPVETAPAPPPNTAPTIGPLAALSVAVGGEGYGPLLARYLGDAEDPVAALEIGVEGDTLVAARLEGGRLVVRGLRAGLGLVAIRVTDTQGASASAQIQVEVRAAAQGPLLRALPKVGLRVGAEKTLDLSVFVFDPDTPTAQLIWTLQPEGGVEARLAGTALSLRGLAAGPARVGLQVADPEGNVAMAALAVQVEEPAPPTPVAPADSAVVVPVDSAAVPAAAAPDTVAAAAPAVDEARPDPVPADSSAAAEDPAGPVSTQLPPPPEIQPVAPSAADTTHGGSPPALPAEVADTAQAGGPEALPVEEVAGPEPATPDTALAVSEPPRVIEQAEEAPPAPSPFDPVVEGPPPAVPPTVVVADSAEVGVAAPAMTTILEVEAAATYQLVAGRLDSALVADRWVRQGALAQIQWSLRGGKRVVAHLDPGSRRLYLDARGALPGREVFYAEAVLGSERRQVVLAVEVRAPRLVLLPFPTLALGAGQALALDLDSYVQGDFAPAELRWAVEAPPGAAVELDVLARVLRVRESGRYSLVLRVYSPWGNLEEVTLEVEGALLPQAPVADSVVAAVATAPPASPPAEALVAPVLQPEAPALVQPLAPTDQTPPRLWLEEVALGGGLELRLGADEELRAAPMVRVNGQVVVVEGGGGEFRAQLEPGQSQVRVEIEGVDLAGNAGQLAVVLAPQEVAPGAAQVYSPDGQWQLAFPQVRTRSWVWLRREGEGQGVRFDAAQTGPVELVVQYPGGEAPAILRNQGGGWEELPTLALAGTSQVYARSEKGGVFKLAGRAGGALPVEPLAYPNPFNAQAAIRYQVGAVGPVRVRVRDGQGRVVRQLVDQIQGPGVRSAVWDGGDKDGQGAASGVYFYEVEVAGRRWTGKLLLLR